MVAVVLDPTPSLMARLRRPPEGDVVGRPVLFSGVDVREMVFGKLVHIHLRFHIRVFGGIRQVVVRDIGPQGQECGVAALVHIRIGFKQIHRFSCHNIVARQIVLVLTLSQVVDAPIHPVDVDDGRTICAPVHIHEFFLKILGERVPEERAHLVVGRTAQVEGLVPIHRSIRKERILERAFTVDTAGMQGERFLRKASTRAAAHDFQSGDLIQPIGAVGLVQFDVGRTFPVAVHVSGRRVAGSRDAIRSGHINAVLVAEKTVRVCHNREHRQIHRLVDEVRLRNHVAGDLARTERRHPKHRCLCQRDGTEISV